MYNEFKGLSRKELERRLENLNRTTLALLKNNKPIPPGIEGRINSLQALLAWPEPEEKEEGQ